MQKEFIARSKGKNGLPEQLYRDHAYGVYSIASSLADKISKKMPADVRENFVKNIKLASEYHDLGKLSPLNQDALYDGTLKRLPYDHWKDGAKFLLSNGILDASLLSVSHHSCLDKRNLQLAEEDLEVNPEFLTIHDNEFSKIEGFSKTPQQEINGLQKAILFRMGLSCLVNGDWDDSAKAKGHDVPECSPTRWRERLAQLRKNVETKTEQRSVDLDKLNWKEPSVIFQKKRHALRRNLFNRTKRLKIDHDVSVLSATVGMGKTYSYIQLALRQAIKQNSPHIIIVAPFNHIVDQIVEELNRNVILEGEEKLPVVGNHTCTAICNNWKVQDNVSRWRCPIVVTSAVQFFETLSSNVAGKLVKLSEVPNSIIVMDEWHSIMGEHLIEFYWDEMNNLSKMFNTKFILSSGSMTRFWDESFNGKFASKTEISIQEVTTKAFMDRSVKAEAGRVVYHHIGNLSAVDLMNRVLFLEGKGKKTIVLMSTTKNVAIMAKRLINKGRNVYTVYGSLIDKDSGEHVKKIKNDNSDWIVVCTTSIESGIDISGEVAFSVDRSIMSQVQLGGRINREGLYKESKVLVFKEIQGELNDNSSFEAPSDITKRLGLLNKIANADECTRQYLLELEISSENKEKKQLLRKATKANIFPVISKESRLINEGRGSVLVGPRAQELFDVLSKKENGETIKYEEGKLIGSMKEIAQNSVPMPTIKTKNADPRVDFVPSEFESVPGFTIKDSKDDEISTLMIYRGGYDPEYFGIWKDKI